MSDIGLVGAIMEEVSNIHTILCEIMPSPEKAEAFMPVLCWALEASNPMADRPSAEVHDGPEKVYKNVGPKWKWDSEESVDKGKNYIMDHIGEAKTDGNVLLFRAFVSFTLDYISISVYGSLYENADASAYISTKSPSGRASCGIEGHKFFPLHTFAREFASDLRTVLMRWDKPISEADE